MGFSYCWFSQVSMSGIYSLQRLASSLTARKWWRKHA
jgi:hypothetical protein